MADILPAFPLSLVAFPGEEVNLHIFEPRYKQLFLECEAKGITFAILPSFDGVDSEYATEMELVKIAKTYPDGKMDVMTKGVGLCKVMTYFDRHPNKLYPAVEFEKLAWSDHSDLILNLEILELVGTLYETMNVDNVEIKSEADFRTYQIAHKVGMTQSQELEFLSINDERSRQLYMLDHLQKLIPVVEEMEVMRQRAAMNGHFKNVLPMK